MQICVVGTGYVGLVTGACLADFGMEVTCVDKIAAKIEMLERGDIERIMAGTQRFRRGAGGLRVVAAEPGQPPATKA